MKLDRTQAPPSRLPDNLSIPPVERLELPNGAVLYYLENRVEPLLKFEIIYRFPYPDTLDKAATRLAPALMREGTIRHTSAELHASLERLGAFLDFSSTIDGFKAVVYMMKENAIDTLNLVFSMLREPAFPEREMEEIRNQEISKFRINSGKSSFLADRKFRELLFGGDHPYGRNYTLESLQSLDRDQVKEYYRRGPESSEFRVFLTGDIDDRDLNELVERLAQFPVKKSSDATALITPEHRGPSEASELMDTSVQTSLRLGCFMPDRAHPDTHKISLANELLGGYFGSRLMKRIREEKGYTYGIYSVIRHYNFSSHLRIAAEVMKSSRGEAMEDIRKEVRRLIENPVPEDELDLVKNNHIGSLLTNINSPFAVMEIHKQIALHSLSDSFYNERVNQVRGLNAEELQRIYSTYFSEERQVAVLLG